MLLGAPLPLPDPVVEDTDAHIVMPADNCVFDTSDFDPVDMEVDNESSSSSDESEHVGTQADEVPDHLIRSLAMGLRPRR